MAVRRRYDKMPAGVGVAGDYHRSYRVTVYMELAAETALHATMLLFRGEARGVGESIRRIVRASRGGSQQSWTSALTPIRDCQATVRHQQSTSSRSGP